jgi:hypothetical protein
MRVTLLLQKADGAATTSLKARIALVEAIRESMAGHREVHLRLMSATTKTIEASHVAIRNCGWRQEWHTAPPLNDSSKKAHA